MLAYEKKWKKCTRSFDIKDFFAIKKLSGTAKNPVSNMIDDFSIGRQACGSHSLYATQTTANEMHMHLFFWAN